MTIEETIEYIKSGLSKYYEDRRKKGYYVPDETIEEFFRVLTNIEGVAELFTPVRKLQELPYSNAPDCPHRAKAQEHREERNAACKQYPLANKVYWAYISRYTVWKVDEVTPHLEKIINEFKKERTVCESSNTELIKRKETIWMNDKTSNHC